MIKQNYPMHCQNYVDRKSVGQQRNTVIVSMARLTVWRDLMHSGRGKKEEQAFLAKEQGLLKDGYCRNWKKVITPMSWTKRGQKFLPFH